jgi:hypothetical protein
MRDGSQPADAAVPPSGQVTSTPPTAADKTTIDVEAKNKS